ncbi:MAG: hypothetical protein ACXVYW_09245 [Oryzihumus sp.]
MRHPEHRLARPPSGALPLAAVVTALVLLLGTWHGLGHVSPSAAPSSDATLHYAANDNVTARGRYAPGALGFNLADVSTRAELNALPSGVKALVFLGTCEGVDRRFVSRASQFTNDPRVFGFYLYDEPLPGPCPPARLKQQADWLHAHDPGTRTFMIVQNLSSSRHPSYRGGYTQENSGIDLFGIAPYPCRSELHGCDMSMVGDYVRAAADAGIPRARMVPVFQAFGGGTWRDDGGGRYLLPTPAEATRLLAEWSTVLPSPVFDAVYSWGQQRGDRSLATASDALQQVFAAHNRGLR